MNKLSFKYIFLVVLIISGIFIALFLTYKPKANTENENIVKEEKSVDLQKKDYLLGKFEPSERKDFILIPKEYTVLESSMYLRKETLEAFLKMKDSGIVDGINLKIASATRNFDDQKNIWEKKWSGATLVERKNLAQTTSEGIERFKKILEYSAAPGTSRHHFGTDIDINSVDPVYFETEKGQKEYGWLVTNAPEFGFCQTYNQKGSNRLNGYNEEKWHWSYVPISKQLIEEYKNLIKDEDIKGFLGEEFVPQMNLINNYVLSINPDCL